MLNHGVDLHPGFFVVWSRAPGSDDKSGFEKRYRSDDGGVEKFRKTLSPEDQIAFEATGNAHWFMQRVMDDVSVVKMVNSRNFDIVRKSTSKTDRNDARSLAFFLEKDMLPECRIKSQEQRDLSALCRSRDKLVKQRTDHVNRIHSYYSGVGHRLKKESLTRAKHLNQLDFERLTEAQQFDVKTRRDQILHLNTVIRDYDKKIEETASEMKGHRGLTSIKGIASTSASTFIASFGDIENFSSFKQVCSFLGLTPENRHSGDKKRSGPTSRKGDRLARTALVQATMSAMRYSPFLQQFYSRIKAKRGTGRAIIATARKFLKIIYNTLKNGWVFKDFPNFVLES